MEADSTKAFFTRPFFKALIAEKIFRNVQNLSSGAASFYIGITGESLRNELQHSGRSAFTKIEALYESTDPDLVRFFEKTVGARLLTDQILSRKCRNTSESLGTGDLPPSHVYTLFVAFAPYIPESSERLLFPVHEFRGSKSA